MSGFKKSAFSVVDFATRFDTEDKCREHFFQLRFDEFCFRFNRRDYGASLFERLLTAGVECAYVGYLG